MDILTVKKKIRKHIVNDTIVYYVTNDKLFVTPNLTHSIAFVMLEKIKFSAELKMKYYNITNETIMASCLSLCIYYQKKSSKPKRGLISKLILHNAFKASAQIGLIHKMQSLSINNFRFIMSYQDYHSKFVILKSLTKYT